MTKDEFVQLVQDFVVGQLMGPDWRYTCSELKAERNKETGRDEIKIVYSPYKVEHNVSSMTEFLKNKEK